MYLEFIFNVQKILNISLMAKYKHHFKHYKLWVNDTAVFIKLGTNVYAWYGPLSLVAPHITWQAGNTDRSRSCC